MSTGTHDLVLVHIEAKPAFYARIEDISPDVKPGWWQVKLLVLTLPLQVFTWILEESQINGTPFTMGGTPVVLEKVESPSAPEPDEEEEAGPSPAKPGEKVISIFSRKPTEKG